MRNRTLMGVASLAGMVSLGMMTRSAVDEIIDSDVVLSSRRPRKNSKEHTHSREIARRLRQEARRCAK